MLKRDIWLYLHFPLLPLETLLPQVPIEQAQKPIAVVSLQKNIQRVLCCNTQAAAWGIEPNLSISTALALCPELEVLPRQIEQEQQLLQQLALVAYSFSPVVILTDFGLFNHSSGLWLEISGCYKLFKGYDALLRELDYRLRFQSITAVNGIGQNPLAAKLLCGPDFETQLPDQTEIQRRLLSTDLSLLEINRKQQQSFKQLGLNTVGDLLALPRSALSRRFNAELMLTIAQLNNEKPFNAPRFQPANSFRDLIQNPQGIFNKESLLFPMKTLLQHLCQYLMARQCHCREIEWHFEPLIGESQKMQIQLSGSQNNWSTLLMLSRLQLERLELPLSIEQIILHVDQFIEAPMGVFNLDLFDNQKTAQQSCELIDSLNARLGIDALSQPILNQDYLPEQASTLATPGKHSNTSLNEKLKAPQPLWLLTDPAPVHLRNKKLYWRQPLTIISGPERLCGNWWQAEQQRDYYLACDSNGARYWLFRETSSQRWFVHGLFS
ncbi:MAG: DNA polymerase Y family protein [Porticoccaceae bacterium]|nr:DNA polymerase Y family protein [Porticoccaceae bacterium]